MNRNSKK